MNRFGAVSTKTAAIAVVALVVAGGSVLALLKTNENISASQAQMSPNSYVVNGSFGWGASYAGTVAGSAGTVGGSTYHSPVETSSSTTMASTTASLPTTEIVNSGVTASGAQSPSQATQPPTNESTSGGRSIEFYANVTMTSRNPTSTLSSISSLAYSEGGYVAYSSSENGSAYVVVRVPAAEFPTALASVESLGTVTSATSSSNDVTIQYTDLNASLASLRTEENALLRLLNASTTVNATLAIENQLEQIDAQINYTESQIQETARLVAYSTITVSIQEPVAQVQPKPLSMKLAVTPLSGLSPLSVTFNALVTGGTGSYLVNYNFGDGTSSQGQTLVHQFVGAGTYNVTVTATDTNGSVASSSALVRVTSPPTNYGQTAFWSGLFGVFVGEVEDIVEVAVVAVPLVLVAALILVPLQKRRTAKNVPVKQS